MRNMRVWRGIGRYKIELLCLLLLIASICVGALFPYGAEDTRSEEEYLRSKTQGKGFMDIFAFILGNNTPLLVGMLIPGVGIFIGIFLTFSSGMFLGGLSILAGINSIFVLILMFVLPNTIVEFLAYAVAVAGSYKSARLIAEKKFKDVLRSEAKSLLLGEVILTLAALLETLMSLFFV